MLQKQQIIDNIEAINSLKGLAQSYEEIAVIRMQKIRDSVIKTRGYLTELSDVFVDLKSSYEREIRELLAKRKEGDKSLPPELKKKGGALLIYMSSNAKFYGSITSATYRLFVEDTKKPEFSTADLVIIGKVGKDLYEESSKHKAYKYFELPDTDIKLDDIRKMVETFLQYEKVYIYYGKFANVVKQVPSSTSITGEDIFEAEVKNPTPREDRFIFEPDLEKIFHFFEAQIVANLFSQTLLENQLARHSSRINSMEEILGHVEEESKKLTAMKNQLRQQIENTKQMETISGMALWS
jgi:ATP synthase F1 gamma subunit